MSNDKVGGTFHGGDGYDGSGIVPQYISDKVPHSSADLLTQTGMTMRQLDHWTRRGYLHPVNPAPGQGTPLVWPGKEVRIAVLVVRLARAGFTVPAAAHLARTVVEGTASPAAEALVAAALTYATDM